MAAEQQLEVLADEFFGHYVFLVADVVEEEVYILQLAEEVVDVMKAL